MEVSGIDEQTDCLFNIVQSMDVDSFARFIVECSEYAGWCTSSEEDICAGDHCERCAKAWLTKDIKS